MILGTWSGSGRDFHVNLDRKRLDSLVIGDMNRLSVLTPDISKNRMQQEKINRFSSIKYIQFEKSVKRLELAKMCVCVWSVIDTQHFLTPLSGCGFSIISRVVMTAFW